MACLKEAGADGGRAGANPPEPHTLHCSQDPEPSQSSVVGPLEHYKAHLNAISTDDTVPPKQGLHPLNEAPGGGSGAKGGGGGTQSMKNGPIL